MEERLDLDIDEALRGIDRVEEALTGSATSFKVALAEALDLLSTVAVGDVDAGNVTSAIDAAIASADLEPTVDADASGVTQAIDSAVADADLEPVIEADASGVTTEIDSAIANADTTPVIEADATPVTAAIDDAVSAADATVEVDADTSAADAALEDLGGTAKQVGSSGDFAGLTGGLDGVSAAAGAATGSLAGTGDALGGMVPEAKAAVVGLGAVVAVSGELFKQALESETAQLRFNRALGDMASRVSTIHIEGFSKNLEELAEKTGNSDEALKLAAARIGDLGHSAGASNDEIATTASNVLLLATNLSVTNPTLGDAGDIADRLTAALARGGRALTPYGINLSSAAIQARAVADANGDASAATDRFALAAAGAALVSEQMGSSLKSGIVEGAKSTVIQLRSIKEEFNNTLESLGRPFLQPVIESAREGEPVLEDLATVFGELGADLIPLFVDTLKLIAPEIHATAEAAHLLLTPLKLVGSVIDLIPGHAKSAADTTKSSFDDLSTSVVDNLTAIARAKLPSNQLDDIDRLGLGVDRLGKLASQGKAGLNEFLTTLQRGGEITASVADALRKNGGDVEDLIAHHSKLGVSQDQLNQSNLDLVRTFGETSDAQQKQAKAALEAIASNDELTTSQRNIAREALNAKGAHVDYVAAVGRIKGASEDAKGGTDDLTGSLKDQQDQAGLTEESLGTLLDAVLGFVDSTLAADNASVRFSDSLASVTEKQAALAKAVADHKQGSVEAAKAQHDLDDAIRSARDAAVASARAQVQLALDTGKVQEGASGAAARFAIYRQSLVDAATKAGPGSPVQQALLSLIAQLDATKAAGDLNLKVTADTAQAEAALRRTQLAADRLVRSGGSATLTARGRGLMAGGDFVVGAGEVIRFGERGPEDVFIPGGTAGHAFTAVETRRGAASGDTPPIVNNIFEAVDAAATADTVSRRMALQAKLG